MNFYRWPFLVFALLVHLPEAASQQRFDIVINEIMADPSPQVGLPNVEYIELKNASGNDIHLAGWKIAANSVSSTFPNYTLSAGGFVILCSNSSVNQLASYANVLGLSSFPSLPNDGAAVVLTSQENRVIHFATYKPALHKNQIKEEGGWSLEMIDSQTPCAGTSNWDWSIGNDGGTPGKENSIASTNKDENAPRLQNTYLQDDRTIILRFDEPVDSAASVHVQNFLSVPSAQVDAVSVLLPDFSEIQLKLASPLSPSAVYAITISGIKDCAGNEIRNGTETNIGLPQHAAVSDIIINEILFNPKPDASDYIELYNRSDKIIDASKLYIANRNSSLVISSSKKISEQPFYLFPGDYVVVTEDAPALQRNYLVKQSEKILSIASMPSFPDDRGSIVLADFQGNIIDEVTYEDDWHFALLNDDEGVALERINPDKSSKEAGNWRSAASTAGYGTPGYRNSQYNQTGASNAAIEITPKVFSPDNDGYEDIASVRYSVDEIGYVANIIIFDATGRTVCHFVKNAILGLSGSWNWDGLDEKGQKLPIGNYIVFTELFNLQGKKKSFKNVIVLARKLR